MTEPKLPGTEDGELDMDELDSVSGGMDTPKLPVIRMPSGGGSGGKIAGGGTVPTETKPGTTDPGPKIL